jgi:hypothetical protein
VDAVTCAHLPIVGPDIPNSADPSDFQSQFAKKLQAKCPRAIKTTYYL